MIPSHELKQNGLLASLSPAACARLLPNLELVPLSAGDGIYESGVHIRYLYFPIDCIVCSIGELASGRALLTSLTGNEGMVGVSYLLGCKDAQARAVTLTGGSAFRIKASLLEKEFDLGEELQGLLLTFTHALLVQTIHIAAGARYFSIEQRLSYLLLMLLDRLPGNALRITHDQVSILLGARRESITTVAQELEKTGAITYRRGHMFITNRQELEIRVCESYGVVNKAYRGLQKSPAPSLL